MKHLIDHKPLRLVVAEKLRGMIMSGEIKAGERLIEDRLATQLGVSRNPIREAIRLLEASGLVEVIPRRGAYVAMFDFDLANKIQELRTVLETWIVVEATLHHTDADIERIDKCVADGRRFSSDGNLLGAAAMHREFHIAIEDACGNPFIGPVMEPLRQRTEMVFSVLSEDRALVSWDEHNQIRDSIVARDTDRARDLMVSHILASMDAFAGSTALIRTNEKRNID